MADTVEASSAQSHQTRHPPAAYRAAFAPTCRREASQLRSRELCGEQQGVELFRRAICERDQPAWAAVLARYQGLALAWVRQHAAAAPADDHDRVSRAFERFWMAVRPERFQQFATLPALLQYLKLCVHSIVMDEVRARPAAATEPLDGVAPGRLAAAEADVVPRLAGRDVWQAVAEALRDEGDRLVAYLSFVCDLKPSEIHKRHPDRFHSVHDVYRVKRNLLDRLQRNPRLQRAWLAAG